MSTPGAIWQQLEALGLSEIAMSEQVRAKRALVNADGGALSVKKPKEEPALKELGKLLKRIMEAAEESC